MVLRVIRATLRGGFYKALIQNRSPDNTQRHPGVIARLFTV